MDCRSLIQRSLAARRPVQRSRSRHEKKALGHHRSSFFRVVWEGRTQERKPVEFGPLVKSQVSSAHISVYYSGSWAIYSPTLYAVILLVGVSKAFCLHASMSSLYCLRRSFLCFESLRSRSRTSCHTSSFDRGNSISCS